MPAIPGAPEPAGAAGPSGRGHRRRLVAVVSVGGLVVILAVVFTLAGWLGSPADDSPGPGSGATQAAGPTGPATAPGAGATGSGSSPGPGSGSGSAAGTGHPTGKGSGAPPVLPSAHPTGTGTGKAATVLVGTGCPLDGGRSVATSGRWDPQKTGGWSDDGCGGGYLTHRTAAAAADSVTWQFATKATTSCAIEVYVPINGTAPKAFYNVISGSDVSGFTLNQANNHGRWVSAGTLPVHPGPVSVRLSDRGDGKSVVAADAVRLTCH